jgi:hypothetical protein
MKITIKIINRKLHGVVLFYFDRVMFFSLHEMNYQ